MRLCLLLTSELIAILLIYLHTNLPQINSALKSLSLGISELKQGSRLITPLHLVMQANTLHPSL